MSLRSPSTKAASWQPDCECYVFVYRCVSVRPSNHLSVCQSVRPTICMAVHPTICLSACPSACHCLAVAVSQYASGGCSTLEQGSLPYQSHQCCPHLRYFVSHSAPAQLLIELCQDGMLLHHFFRLDAVANSMLSGTGLWACLLNACWTCFMILLTQTRQHSATAAHGSA